MGNSSPWRGKKPSSPIPSRKLMPAPAPPIRRIKDSCLSTSFRLEGHGSMVIVGEWFPGDDGITRPIVRAKVPGAGGTLSPERFLVGNSAAPTLFTSAFFHELQGIRNCA